MTPISLPQISQVKPLFDYIKKRREDQKFIRTLEIAGTFIVISFFMFFAIKPTVITISALLGDIQSKKILAKELRTKIDDVITAQDLFSQVQENYQIVNASLPDRPEYYQAATQIQQQGQVLGLNSDNLTFSFTDSEDTDQLKKSDTKNYAVNLSLSGDFVSVSRLISELIKNRRIMSIETINFTGATDDLASTASPSASSNTKLNTRFTVKLYYWPPTTDEKK